MISSSVSRSPSTSVVASVEIRSSAGSVRLRCMIGSTNAVNSSEHRRAKSWFCWMSSMPSAHVVTCSSDAWGRPSRRRMILNG